MHEGLNKRSRGVQERRKVRGKSAAEWREDRTSEEKRERARERDRTDETGESEGRGDECAMGGR